ncbi:hypothetical protein L596_010611 [Steinernema carpocapsae]|uniref:Uncharacterized protein n=1 Tax=Steinernema carpocapsae TaxID=34508 RepID=A0A4U5PKC0_STECR|nr:hypothetical protein L596_010611 [Steinernema carpocapsae]
MKLSVVLLLSLIGSVLLATKDLFAYDSAIDGAEGQQNLEGHYDFYDDYEFEGNLIRTCNLMTFIYKYVDVCGHRPIRKK